jgi:hypothetical protein
MIYASGIFPFHGTNAIKVFYLCQYYYGTVKKSLKRISSFQVILDFIWKRDIFKKIKKELQGIAAGFENFKVKNR